MLDTHYTSNSSKFAGTQLFLLAAGVLPAVEQYLVDVFGSGGYLSRDSGYAVRRPQMQLADAFDRCFRDGTHTMAEGPCGTGKSLAYLVPAIWHAVHARKRVLIATKTIKLQDQLIGQDLPRLQRDLPWPFSFAVAKGRANYVCLDALEKTKRRLDLYEPGQLAEAEQILKWAEPSATGDRKDLSFSSSIWSDVSVTGEKCLGDDCDFRAECFSERAKAAARTAAIVVTNFDLLFLQLQNPQSKILPPYDILILDEAHEAIEVARSKFTREITPNVFKSLADGVAATTTQTTVRDACEGLIHASRDLFRGLAEVAKSAQYREDNILLPSHRASLAKHIGSAALSTLRQLQELTAYMIARCESNRVKSRAREISKEEKADFRRHANLLRRLNSLREDLKDALLQSSWPQYCYQIQDGMLAAIPIDMAAILASTALWSVPVALASATLSTGGSFDFVRDQLGVPSPLQMKVPSPFRPEQTLLVVASSAEIETYDWERPDIFDGQARAMLQRLVRMTDGRMLALFTTTQARDEAYTALLRTVPYRVLCQNKGTPDARLIEEFRDDTHSILLGTMKGFGTGLDIQDETLSCVVMDRIPYLPPSDPIISSLQILQRSNHALIGPRTWQERRAALEIRQSAGRGVRTITDVAVVVVLDHRCAANETKTHAFFSELGTPLDGILDHADLIRNHLGVDAAEVEERYRAMPKGREVEEITAEELERLLQ